MKMKATLEFALKRVSLANCCFLLWLGLTLILSIEFTEVSAHEINIVGEVKPAEVQIDIGANISITCQMNSIYFNGYNSSCLSFYREHNNIPVPKENTHVVNESSIIYFIRDAQKDETDKYICKCTANDTTKEVSSTKILVGANVINFKCRDINFSYMECKYTIPESKIHSDYQLKIGGQICPEYCDVNCELNNSFRPSERICNLTGDKYRQVYTNYHFKLIQTNSLGDNFTMFINKTLDEYLVPPTPKVVAGNLTANSVTLYMTLDKLLEYNSAGGLQFKITLCPEKFECFDTNTKAVLHENFNHFKAELHNLQYPNRRYDFTVKSITNIANHSDKTMWSEPFKGNFSTMPRRPDRAPNVDVGSFFIDFPGKKIRLYWEKLAEYEENGLNFNYSFTEVWRNGKLINRSLEEMDDNSALFTYEYTSNYTFKLCSQNEYGRSLNSSVFEIRSREPTEISKQEIITKINHQHNNTYTVFWEQSKDFNNLSNLTLFICEAKQESKDCKGDFHFVTLNKTRLDYTTISTSKTLNFALSRNYKNYSTGMLWAGMCPFDYETNQNISLNTSSSDSTLHLQWNTQCWYSLIFRDYKYNMTYCMTESKFGKECIENSTSMLIPIMKSSHLIENLQPSTYYKVWIRMVSQDDEGPLTESIFATNAEKNITKLIIIRIFLVVLSVFLLLVLIRKYVIASDIEAKLPSGIIDSEIKRPTKISRFKGFCGIFKKQENTLEPAICNDPYVPRIVIQEKTESKQYSNGYIATINSNNTYVHPQSQDLRGDFNDDGYLQMNQSAKPSLPSGIIDSEIKRPTIISRLKDLRSSFKKQENTLEPAICNDRYVPPVVIQETTESNQHSNSIMINSNNTYVHPQSQDLREDFTNDGCLHMNKSAEPSLNGYFGSLNGYVVPNNGYIPFSSLNKRVDPNAVCISHPSVSGYVTVNSRFLTIDQSNSKTIKKRKELFDISQGLKFLWFFVITMCLATSPVSASDYVGEVIPHDVELPIGGSVNITCRMNRSYFNDHNSSCLAFFRDDGNLRVPKEHIHVVDDSSIVFMVRNATEQRAQYTCKCHNKGVYITNIFVGTPPTNVTDFQCLGYDFSFMTCNFTVPHNKIYTDYKLKFSSSSPDYIYTCNLQNGHQPSERICNLTMDNNNYRIVYQYYNFELTASNKLGNLTQSIMIDQYNRIVPAKPLIEVGNVTTNSVTLFWMVNKFSQYTHTDGLQYEIRLRPEKFDWFYINTNAVLQKNKEHYKTEINNLQYPYRRYDFSVRVKTVRANNSDETMWSEPFEGIFYTKPRRPERAPNMDVGSFYIDPTEQNIRLYWQQLAEYEENGPDFLYNITEVRRNGKLINVMPSQMDSTSATYNWERTSHYQFKLQSQNQVGKSLNTSILEVHPSTKRLQQIEQIQVITKVYHNQTYTITWRQPSDMNSLRNFTLFWCISKMESQSQCKGTINFKHFDKYTTNHTTEPQNHTLNFAVSANYDTFSTGMMWAMCTADGATDLNKMDPETSAISSNSIKVQWSTECLYMAILEGYNLTYCKVENHVPEMIGNCINAEKTISISKRAKEYTITDLDPFTTYKISILMYSKLKTGPMSNPVIETTTEDAPSPPRKLKKYNVTSDSVTLSWLPPKHSNGNLRYYTVWYKNEGTVVNSTSNANESEIFFLLEDLSSYSDYKVYVTAHTVKSSGPSNDIHFKTLIGIPSPPLSFNMNRNEKELVFHWSPPKLPSGRVEFYEVRVTVNKNNESEILKTSRVVGLFCRMTIPCTDPNNSYIFDVRAVNLAERSEVDYHTFSKRDTSYLNNLHQGGTKKRRHSNAEINASVGAPYQIHETTEKNIRHRHERENLKLIQTTEPSYVTQEEIDEDFTCLGGEKETLKIPREYKDANQYKLFYSPWQNGPYFACSETKFSKLTMLALVVILVTMVLLASVYYARKKYNKMSNISLVIPEGLVDNINVSKGIDNKIERDEIIRNDELFYEKENHRLLSKVGNDSGFLNSVHCLDKSSGYACSDLQDSEKSSQSTDSVELNDITSCSYTSSPSHSPNANIREMSIPEERMNSPVLQPSVQLRPSQNGYIKPIMMSNGYVQPQAFQKLQPKETPSFNGYTSLDAMGKPIFPQTSTAAPAPVAPERNSYEIPGAKNVNNKDIAIPHPVSGNICGYVTHKQLSDFGRLQ